MYSLPKLKFQYHELEPYYDAKTVEIHYTKHHQTYIDNLNKLLTNAPQDFQSMPLETLLLNLDKLPSDIATGIRNNAGGHFCHSLFWQQFTSHPTTYGGKIAQLIERDFKNKENFIELFSQQARTLFGSGWTWLVLDTNNHLQIISTSGHNTPLELGYKPLLVIDMWEHAYYLKYQNRKNEWINAFWNLINWDFINQELN